MPREIELLLHHKNKEMFVTVYKIVREGVFVYENEKSCCTTKRFIPNKHIDPWVQLIPGDQLVYNLNDMKATRGYFINCHFCHKSMDSNEAQLKCDCKNTEGELLTSQGILTNKEFKCYKTGGALKIKLEKDDTSDVLHSVIFENNALFTAFQEMPLGVMVHFKANIKNMDNGHILLNIFHIW